jgi:hypothetical protein
MRKKPSNKHHPYREWEIEFISSDKSINEFALTHGFDENNVKAFYRYVKINKWEERRKAFFDKAYEKFMAKAPDAMADNWLEYRGALSRVYRQIMRKVEAAEMAEVKSVPIRDLREIAETLATLSKTKSFIEGGPTDRTESKSLSVNIHANIADEIEREGDTFDAMNNGSKV